MGRYLPIVWSDTDVDIWQLLRQIELRILPRHVAETVVLQVVVKAWGCGYCAGTNDYNFIPTFSHNLKGIWSMLNFWL